MEEKNVRLGIDLGGTKIEIIALDERGKVLWRERKPTPHGDYPETLSVISGLVSNAEVELGVTGSLGIGAPGAISRKTGCIKNSNSVCLIGQPLVRDLETRLKRRVRIANDADCFALSEATDGAGRGYQSVFGAIIGTGVGAGIVINGQLLQGPNAIAGEWGHNPLPWIRPEEFPGPLCYCNKTGCIETYLSGPALTSQCPMEAGESIGIRRLVARAAEGDTTCERIMDSYEDRLARDLSHVINVLDPEVIVLGGGLSNISRLYKNIPTIWGEYVFSDVVETRLVPPIYGDSSGVRGAAWLWNKSASSAR